MCPQYLGRECVEVGKGVQALAVYRVVRCLHLKLILKLGTQGVLDVRVTGELNKRPLWDTIQKGKEDEQGGPTVRVPVGWRGRSPDKPLNDVRRKPTCCSLIAS